MSRLLATLVCVLVAVSDVPAQQHVQPVAKPTGTAVTFSGETLFMLYDRVGAFAPEEGAKAATERLVRLAGDPFARTVSVSVADREAGSEIVAGDVMIATVTDGDAAAVDRPRSDVAQEYGRKVQQALDRSTRSFSLERILLGVLFTLIATLALLLIFKLVLNRLFPTVYARIESWRGTYIRSVKIQRLELLPAGRITALLLWLVKAGRLFLVILLLYVYVSLVFSFFPWTHVLAAALFAYTLSTLKAIGQAMTSHVPSLIFLVVIIVATRYVLQLIKFFFTAIQKGVLTFAGFYREWAMPTYEIVRFLVIAFAAAVANVAVGAILTYMRPFQIGDRVKITETFGDVAERTLLVTRVRTIKNVVITIPNAMVLGSHITLSELNQTIQGKFNEAGVEIMSTHYMQLRDGSRTTISEPYLPKDYEAPTWRIVSVENRMKIRPGQSSESGP